MYKFISPFFYQFTLKTKSKTSLTPDTRLFKNRVTAKSDNFKSPCGSEKRSRLYINTASWCDIARMPSWHLYWTKTNEYMTWVTPM